MRYDTKITFYTEKKGQYNPLTSKHEHAREMWEVLANVTDLGTQSQMRLLGKLDSGAKTVRLLEDPPEGWSYLTIGEGKARYVKKTEVKALKGHALIVGEQK
ncbi:hypothetical protein [Lactobacillus crispatus]|uniref:hypothetical protein n=1 Tax=Lactobacillus crispatus TaxID=47770 RepID=UPI0030F90A0A